MATLDELKLQQLLRPFEGPGGIASLNPLAFQYQNQQYLNQDPTQDFYQPNNLSPTQDFYPLDRNPTQMFYQPRNFVNAPQDFYQPDLTTLRGLNLDRFQGVSDMSMIDETTNDEQDQNYIEQVEKSRNPLSGILDLLRNIPTPFNFLRNFDGQPYQQFSPGTTIRNGIVNVAGVNTPYNMFGGDFYNPNTGLNRFDRAAKRFEKTGSMKDLFASSRTGAEFFRKRREFKAAKQRAIETANKNKKAIKQFTGGDGNGSPSIADRSAAATRSRDLGSMRGGVGR